MFELSNNQRSYFGLEPVSDTWDKVILKGDKYRKDSLLYFEGNTIKKQVLSTEFDYLEKQYNEKTENRELILPKTAKGKATKLTSSVLESKTPHGVYVSISSKNGFLIGNYTTEKTFYSSSWEGISGEESIPTLVDNFIKSSPHNHLEEIEQFKSEKRKNIKYNTGDFFAFKINRTEYGFGRILLDIHKLRKKNLISENHGLRLLMGPPLLVKIYALKSKSKKVNLELLKSNKAFPSDYIMDNKLLYGEYEIIGNQDLQRDEFDFPMSFGRSIDFSRKVIFLQWGLIHLERPLGSFEKYIYKNDKLGEHNPYGYYSIGFSPSYGSTYLNSMEENDAAFDFKKGDHYKIEFDLRNPKNVEIRREIMIAFGLQPELGYEENSKLTNTTNILDLLSELKS